MARHPNVIIPEYSDKAYFKITKVPLYGDLYFRGMKAIVGTVFTQEDLLEENMEYKNTKTPATTNGASFEDTFNFVVPVSGSAILLPNFPAHKACFPVTWGGSPTGEFVYKIKVLFIPIPKVVVNAGLTLFEEQTKCLSTALLKYTSDYGELPPGETFPPNSEKFPITYTITNIVSHKSAKITLNDVELKKGDTFGHADLPNLCVKGQLEGAGNLSFSFSVCNNVNKCITGTFNITVKARPFPKIYRSEITINECDSNISITKQHLEVRSEGETDDDFIKFEYLSEKTIALDPLVVANLNESVFNGTFIGNGLTVTNPCPMENKKTTQVLVMKATNGYGKVKEFFFTVRIILKKIELPPANPAEIFYDTNGGCSYKMNFFGQWTINGLCGLWVEILTRDVAEFMEDKPVGQVVVVPNAAEEPIAVLKTPEGLVTIPFNANPPSGETPWPEPKPSPDKPNGEAAAGDLFVSEDGTKFIASGEGTYHAVEGTWPEGQEEPNMDPVILTGDYCVETTNLGGVPSNVGCAIVNGNYLVKNEAGDWEPGEPERLDIQYSTPYFGWIGANEFYARYNQSVSIFFYSLRFYTRFDIVGGGEQLYGNFHRDRTYIPWSNTIGPGPILHKLDISLPLNTYKVHNITNPYAFGPYRKIPGIDDFTRQDFTYIKMQDSRLFAFGSSSRPFKSIYQPPRIDGYDISPTWSQADDVRTTIPYNKKYPIMDYVNLTSDQEVVPFGGPAYGPNLDPHLHFLAWKVAYKLVRKYNPTTKKYDQVFERPQGFAKGQLKIMHNDNFTKAANFKRANGGEFEANLPKAPVTYTFNVRAYDIMTGLTKYRTYKIHYNATGLSPAGNSSETTDNPTEGLGNGFLPPARQTATCQFINNVAQSCKYTGGAG